MRPESGRMENWYVIAIPNDRFPSPLVSWTQGTDFRSYFWWIGVARLKGRAPGAC